MFTSSNGPMGFDFGKRKVSAAATKEKKSVVDDDGDKRPREPKEPKEKKQDSKLLAATLLLAEALPYLRKFAKNKANSNGTRQGAECGDVVSKIDALLKSMTG